MQKNNCSLSDSIINLLRNSTEARPVHWSVFVERFVDSNEHTNAELVSVMNSLLLPLGNVRGCNQNYWIVSAH